MKKLPVAAPAIKLTPKKLASVLLIASVGVAQASIIANEGFNYSTGQLVGQTTTGTGMTGTWSLNTGFGSNTDATVFQVTSGSLTMNHVASSANMLTFNTTATSNVSRAVTASFGSALSTGTMYGSYLFRFTPATTTNGRALGGVLTGTATDNDNTATYAWAGNGYVASSTSDKPQIRVESTNVQPVGAIALSANTTYVMLYEFNATAKTTTAWVLTEDQLNDAFGSLNSTALNARTAFTTAATGNVWTATSTGTLAMGAMDNLTLYANANNAGSTYSFNWDEIRFSNSSLTESITAVPEPSTMALAFGVGLFAVGRVIRRRRNR